MCLYIFGKSFAFQFGFVCIVLRRNLRGTGRFLSQPEEEETFSHPIGKKPETEKAKKSRIRQKFRHVGNRETAGWGCRDRIMHLKGIRRLSWNANQVSRAEDLFPLYPPRLFLSLSYPCSGMGINGNFETTDILRISPMPLIIIIGATCFKQFFIYMVHTIPIYTHLHTVASTKGSGGEIEKGGEILLSWSLSHTFQSFPSSGGGGVRVDFLPWFFLLFPSASAAVGGREKGRRHSAVCVISFLFSFLCSQRERENSARPRPKLPTLKLYKIKPAVYNIHWKVSYFLFLLYEPLIYVPIFNLLCPPLLFPFSFHPLFFRCQSGY